MDALWGDYIATGSTVPIERIIALLPWSEERNDLTKLTLGGMAKFMLASAAERDADLLAILRESEQRAPKEVVGPLADVIDDAEGVDAGRIRMAQNQAIQDLNKNGPGSSRNIAWWGKLGQGAIALGCVGAAVAGQTYLGIPCILGGAASSAALNFFAVRG